jgi:simple sugar transport system substrate-binding protein
VQTGWDAVFKEAQAVKIPVFLVDRDVTVSDPSLYPVTRVAADFVHEGTVAATWLAQTSNGVCNILELQGVTGSSATIDRTNGFNTAIAKFPKMKIVASMSGDFTRNGGQKAMTALIRSQNDLKGICAIWSHNDDMLLGALVALKAAGIKTGQGGILTVSIDGVTDIFKAMADGDASATVELRPDMGTEAFQAVRDYFAGKPVPKRIVVSSPMWFPDTAAEQYAKRSAGR